MNDKVLVGDRVVINPLSPAYDLLPEGEFKVEAIVDDICHVIDKDNKHLSIVRSDLILAPNYRHIQAGDEVVVVNQGANQDIKQGERYMVFDTHIKDDDDTLYLRLRNKGTLIPMLTYYQAKRFELVEPVTKEDDQQEEELTNTKRYLMADGRQLFDHFEEMFPKEKCQAFYELNIFKYATRYAEKNHDKDLHKAQIYTQRLRKLMYGVED